jgi:putative acetyltransferase
MTGAPDPDPGAFDAAVRVSVRLETPGDEDGVRAVELAAFGGPEEAAIVDRIRGEAPDGWQSNVAVDEAGAIVGHVLLSPCPVEDGEGTVVATVLAVGPVAVHPRVQRMGVGSTLMQAVASLAIARGAPALVLLGHDTYYPRFGFEPARELGLRPPTEQWPDHAWMARLLPGWDESMGGTVRYPEAFEPLA